MQHGKLFLVRHGKSAWNHLGLWTGQTDVDLVEEGLAEAHRAGEALSDETVHVAHVSKLKRTHQTLEGMLRAKNHDGLVINEHPALNERHYGEFTGKNKWEVKEQVGEEAFNDIRRGWDVPVPGGETLKDVSDRVVPYYESSIKSDLAAGKNVLVVAHGNSLRALVKHLESLDEDQICNYEVGTGEVHCYAFGEDGKFASKEVRAKNEAKGKV